MWAFVLTKGFAARRRPVTSGPAGMVGMQGVARGSDVVSAKGELWNAHTTTGEPLMPGEEVVVEEIESGLTLRVRPARVHAPA
jgi:membrane-bound ClpP family serine protease